MVRPGGCADRGRTNAWLRDGVEWRSTCTAPIPSVTDIWESCSPNERARCPYRRSNVNATKPTTFQSSLTRLELFKPSRHEPNQICYSVVASWIIVLDLER